MFLFVQNDLLFFTGCERALTQTILNCPEQFCQLVFIQYLVVIIESKDTHIKKLAHRISKAVGIMFELQQYTPRKALQALYYSLIHTHLLYGLPVWGSTHPSYLKKLITLQNKAVKLIGGGLYNDKVSPFYSQLKILMLPYRSKLEIGKFVNGHFQNRLPLNISNYFTLTSNIFLRTTRTIQNTE